MTLPTCLCTVIIQAGHEGRAIRSRSVQGTKYKTRSPTHDQDRQQGQQASRATKRGGVHHQSACASWPGEGFVRGVMMMKKAGRGRIWTEAARVLAASTQHAHCGLQWSRSRRVLQYSSPHRVFFVPRNPDTRSSTVARVFATPRTRACVCLRCVCIPHPRPLPHQANTEEEKKRAPTRPASRSQAAEGERAVDGPEPGTPTLPWQLPSREDTTTVSRLMQ